jgi:hypothetical protein
MDTDATGTQIKDRGTNLEVGAKEEAARRQVNAYWNLEIEDLNDEPKSQDGEENAEDKNDDNGLLTLSGGTEDQVGLGLFVGH